MQWGAPYFLLLLLGAVPLILFLHSLRLKGRRVPVTTLFLLERVLEEQPLGQRLGWLLKNNLLLLLQLLAACLLIVSLADPSLLGYGEGGGDLVLVVDTSASMKAGGPSGSRFEAARKSLLSLVNAKPAGRRVMVIEAGPVPRVVLPFTTDSGAVKALARDLSPTDAPARVKEAVLFAHSFLRRGRPDQVVVFSDGAFDGIETLPWNASSLRWVKASGGSDNVGIVGFEFRRVPGSESEYEIMVRLRNFTDRERVVPLMVMVGDRAVVREPVPLGPEQNRVLIYSYNGPVAGRATALLLVKDDFPTDNHAFLILSRYPRLDVLYIGKGNFFLEQLLASFLEVRLTREPALEPDSLAARASAYDVVVLDGVSPPPLVEGNFILIHAVGEGVPLRAGGNISRPRVIPWKEDHPLARGLRFDDLYIKEALKLDPVGKGITLARSEETPLIYAFETERLRVLVFGFDLLESDLPFKVSFPLLVSNAFAWFRPGNSEFPTLQVQAGTPQTLHFKDAPGAVTVRNPSRRRQVLEEASRTLVYPDTAEVGFYAFNAKAREGEFAVNLFSESESEIRTSFSLPEGNGSASGGAEKNETRWSFWPALVVLVAILLAAEAVAFVYNGGGLPGALVRLPALAALLIALVNPGLFRSVTGLDVVLAVDQSRSVGREGTEQALHVLDEARRRTGARSRLGVLSFAGHPLWEFPPRADFSFADFSVPEGRGRTDLASALQAASAELGEGREGRVLLVSDGNENLGDVRGLVPLLRAQGMQLWVFPVGFPPGQNEVYVKDLVLPHRVDSAETFEVKGAVESLRETTARIQLMGDGVIWEDVTLSLHPGTNWVRFSEVLRTRGSHTLELLVNAAEDTLPENNLLQGVVQVKGPPRVLYLYGSDDSRRYMARVLAVQGYEVDEAAAMRRVQGLSELSAYDLVVLDNLPSYLLSQGKMEVIERYVRDLGGGLLVLGGPNSYGAGGYYRTPLERVLPVEMRPPVRVEFPQVTLLFVLDKSGSMGEGPEGTTKLDLAKAAAIASAELLNPSDQVGLLAFDAEWEWTVPFSPVGEVQWISERIASLQADGGTDLYKVMVEAERAFTGREGAVKHVLVLSDGLTDKNDFPGLVKQLASQGITVSTVSVGSDADRVLLVAIAREGKGRAYATVDPRTIPQIFTTETLLISQDLLVEKPLTPRIVRSGGPMAGLSSAALPPIGGYVLTHPKPLAEVLMRVEKDPLLVSWRYGLGRVAAYTSDVTSRWGKDWVQWKDFPRWSSQVARSVVRRVADSRVLAEFQQEDGEVKVWVDVFTAGGRFANQLNARGILSGPDRAREDRALEQIAPGRYAASFPVSGSGAYFLTVYEAGAAGKTPEVAATIPFVAPYSREYRDVTPNTALLSYLAEQTGGEFLQPSNLREGVARLLTPGKAMGRATRDTWWLFALLGLALFLADLAVRRFYARRSPIVTSP